MSIHPGLLETSHWSGLVCGLLISCLFNIFVSSIAIDEAL